MTAPLRVPLRPIPTRAAVVAGAAAVTAAVLAELLLDQRGLLDLVTAVLAVSAVCYLAVWTSPALIFALGVGATVFSGHSADLGLPIGPDRLLVVAGLGSLLAGLPGSLPRERRIVWRPVHAVLALTVAYAAVSALRAGTLTTEEGIFALLDRLGVVPYLVFVLAPLLFGTRARRDALLSVLVAVGLYLGVTAIAEGVGATAFVLPGYINDPGVGIHFGRARGPFTEAVANGLALYGCAVASAVAAYVWRHRPWAPYVAGLAAALCLGGTIFTLTRAVWLGTVVASFAALMISHRTRRFLTPVVALGALALVAALLFVPGFSDRAEERGSSQRPLWDRYNTNRAAIQAVREEPLFGIGWQRWRTDSSEYLRVSPDYPLTGEKIEVHNVPLSHAAELGLVGLALWGTALTLGVGGAILRPGPAELDPWRLGLVALFIHWALVAAFGPLSYAFPNLLLWTWAGVCSIGHLSERIEA